VRLYQVTCITLDFVQFKGAGVVHSHFACRNMIFRCSSHLGFSTFVASVTMPKKLRSKCLRGRQKQLKQASVSRWPFGTCMFFAHRRQPTSGCRRAAAAGTGACMTCTVRTVLTIHVRQVQFHLPRLPLSATKASLAKLLLHRHPSGAKKFERARNTGKHDEGSTD